MRRGGWWCSFRAPRHASPRRARATAAATERLAPRLPDFLLERRNPRTKLVLACTRVSQGLIDRLLRPALRFASHLLSSLGVLVQSRDLTLQRVDKRLQPTVLLLQLTVLLLRGCRVRLQVVKPVLQFLVASPACSWRCDTAGARAGVDAVGRRLYGTLVNVIDGCGACICVLFTHAAVSTRDRLGRRPSHRCLRVPARAVRSLPVTDKRPVAPKVIRGRSRSCQGRAPRKTRPSGRIRISRTGESRRPASASSSSSSSPSASRHTSSPP